jgi:hypothetical protein
MQTTLIGTSCAARELAAKSENRKKQKLVSERTSISLQIQGKGSIRIHFAKAELEPAFNHLVIDLTDRLLITLQRSASCHVPKGA